MEKAKPNIKKKEKKILSRQLKEDITGYLFILPNLVLYVVFMIFPVLFSLVISFTSWDFSLGFGNIEFNWGQNYIEIWGDKWFTSALLNTFYFVIGTVPIAIILALVFAVIIDKYVIGKLPVKLALFLPYISNIVAISTVWTMLYTDFGPVNQLLRFFGVDNPPKWLGDTSWAMPAVIIMSIWMLVGYGVMIYSSAIQSLPEEVYEAASIDGANVLQTFRYITIPLVAPTTFFLIITKVIASFKVFGQINVMTQGGPGTSTNVLVYYIYTAAFKFFRMGYASAISWILFVILFIITIVQWKAQKKYVDYM